MSVQYRVVVGKKDEPTSPVAGSASAPAKALTAINTIRMRWLSAHRMIVS